ncbi:hypothetical protein FRC19_001543 [Serendipita sp. 401]|nr:hypothetical protein FRC19_001543 [Serendipita sp. 401]KAG8843315.1 hypothetical protein FRC20_004005 [Serendipita sp. 405]KAG9058308.1 hypothetical protein FS842_010678 [Serendipita sp. 407]
MFESRKGAKDKGPLPTLKEGFTHVTRDELRQVCDAIHTNSLPVIKSKLQHDQRMPDERGLTDWVMHELRKVGAIVGEHTQREEGSTGTDMYIKVSLEVEDQDTTDPTGLASGMGGVTISTPHQQPVDLPVDTPVTSTPVKGKSKVFSKLTLSPTKKSRKTVDASSTHDSEDAQNKKKRIYVIQAKSSKPRAQAETEASAKENPQVDVEMEASKASGSTGSTFDLSRFRHSRQPTKAELKATLDKDYPEDPNWEIDFTYRGSNAQFMQMHLLQNYVTQLSAEQDPTVAVFGGYFIYEKSGYIWIPLKDVIELCDKLAKLEGKGKECRPSRSLNRRMTRYFLALEEAERGNPPTVEPTESTSTPQPVLHLPERCFLEEMHNHLMVVPGH